MKGRRGFFRPIRFFCSRQLTPLTDAAPVQGLTILYRPDDPLLDDSGEEPASAPVAVAAITRRQVGLVVQGAGGQVDVLGGPVALGAILLQSVVAEDAIAPVLVARLADVPSSVLAVERELLRQAHAAPDGGGVPRRRSDGIEQRRCSQQTLYPLTSPLSAGGFCLAHPLVGLLEATGPKVDPVPLDLNESGIIAFWASLPAVLGDRFACHRDGLPTPKRIT